MVRLATPHQTLPEQPPAVAPGPDLLPAVAQDYVRSPLRKKLPAYGRQLLQLRRCGEHPSAINVVYGERWRDVVWPKVCVLPAKYVPGTVDWRVVAGVKAVVCDLAAGLADFNVEGNRYGPLYSLIGELVEIGAYVVVRFPENGKWSEETADALAYACRWNQQWPAWWSDVLDRRHRIALSGCLDDMRRKLRRKTERGCEK